MFREPSMLLTSDTSGDSKGNMEAAVDGLYSVFYGSSANCKIYISLAKVVLAPKTNRYVPLAGWRWRIRHGGTSRQIRRVQVFAQVYMNRCDGSRVF